jgi:hypothetical protein
MRVAHDAGRRRFAVRGSGEVEVSVDVPQTDDVMPPARAGSWRTAVVLSGALGLWLVVSRYLPSAFVGGADLTIVGALPLVAALAYAVASRIVRIALPGARAREWRAVVLLVVTALVVPLGFLVFRSAGETVPPASAPAERALPDVAALLGKGSDDVERALGVAYGREQERVPDSIGVRPWEGATARVVAYALGDVEGWWARDPDAPAIGGASRLWQASAPAPNTGDGGATVTVYYSVDGAALGARLVLRLVSADSARGPDWRKRFLNACGLAGDVVRKDPPAWAIASDEATPGPALDEWGLVGDASTGIGYHLRIARPSAAGVASSGAPVAGPDETGVLVLTLGPRLVDQFTASGSLTSSDGTRTGAASDASGALAAVEATVTFAERGFYVIVFDSGASETAILTRSERLNRRASSSGEPSPAVVVERSGHLRGLADGDYWVIISSAGFESELDASRSAAGLSLRVGIVQDIRMVTKRCGDLTIRRIQPEAVVR